MPKNSEIKIRQFSLPDLRQILKLKIKAKPVPFMEEIHRLAIGIGMPLTDPLLSAFATVDRRNYIPEDLVPYVDLDKNLSRTKGISTLPSLMFIMSSVLQLDNTKSVLVIGTGTGYQTEIISKVAKRVVTIEQDRHLAEQAQQRLEKAGVNNVVHIVADGAQGWQEGAPYDAVLITAGISDIPHNLLDQMKDSAICVEPVGSWSNRDSRVNGKLVKLTKIGPDKFYHEWYTSPKLVYFAPLVSTLPMGFIEKTPNVFIPSHQPVYSQHGRLRRT